MPLLPLKSHAGRAPRSHSFEMSFDPISCAVYNASCVTRASHPSRCVDLIATLRDTDQPRLALDLCLCLVVGDLMRNIYGRVVEICAVGNHMALLRLESNDSRSYLVLCGRADCALPAMTWLRYVINPSKWLDLFESRPDQPPPDQPPARSTPSLAGRSQSPTIYPPTPAPSFVTMLSSSKEDWARPL
ncbi:hypothetical protein FOMPIDRAFT_84461 [Fomitopsis schrenkii]|uniref:Uncharacterized protein n=1 Tax=Fomitopsis schrenkii TaxID=2126942 RepID=S8E0X8_FOMSC|nr:hypothetical protein FOMPIDRAFT_84461 [Fomitopsis schrenkii]